MSWLARLVSVLRNTTKKDRVEQDLDEEIRAYADLLADEKEGRGMSAGEARRQALVEMGGVEPVKEAVREVRAGALLETLWRDVRFGARLLRRSPGFTLAAVVSLGLGIGINTGIFAVLDTLLLRPLPVAEPHRLVDIYTSGSFGGMFSSSSVPDLKDYRAQTPGLVDVIGYAPMFAAVHRGQDPARLMLGEIVTGNYFEMLGVRARIGRTLMPADDEPGAPNVVVVSEAVWRREFGADPALVGRTLRVRGEPSTIVGVIDGGFSGMVPMVAPELWVPLARVADVEPAGINENTPSPTGTGPLDRRGRRWLFAKARLKPDVTVDQVAGAVQVVGARLAAAYPETNKDRRVTVRAASATRLHPHLDGLLARIGAGTMLAVGLVLLIACANVAGMLLARGMARTREISIRLALGASRRRLVQQLLIESLLLAGAGAIVGLLMAWWSIGLLTSVTLPVAFPVSLNLHVDGRVIGFTVAASVLAAVLAGLVPALRATRPDLVSALRGQLTLGSGWAAGRRWTLRDALVVGQIAVTMVLVVVAALLVRSVTASRHADVGFRPDGLAVIFTDTRTMRYSSERNLAFYEEALRRVRALPGVERAATSSRVPSSIGYNYMMVAVPGRQATPDDMGPPIPNASVTPEYFETLGIPIVHGRTFASTDTAKAPPVAVINQTMARQYWPEGQAVGQRVFERTLSSGVSFEIVGVVADHTMGRPGEPPRPVIYFASAQRPTAYNYIIARRRGAEQTLLAEMRRALFAVDPNVLLIESETMRDHMSAILLPAQASAVLVTAFGGLALLLAAVGLYGVIAFSVTRRTREIGIRLAIGARPQSVLAGVMRQGLTLAIVGIVSGVALAALAARVVAGMLYGIGAADPLAWSGAALTLLTIAALANLVPAWRAMRLDPSRALRVE